MIFCCSFAELTTFLGIECLTCQLSQELIFKLTTIFSTLQESW
nr:MAG TPA: hypothetical protein [Caudoviricetes sp.]